MMLTAVGGPPRLTLPQLAGWLRPLLLGMPDEEGNHCHYTSCSEVSRHCKSADALGPLQGQ